MSIDVGKLYCKKCNEELSEEDLLHSETFNNFGVPHVKERYQCPKCKRWNEFRLVIIMINHEKVKALRIPSDRIRQLIEDIEEQEDNIVEDVRAYTS